MHTMVFVCFLDSKTMTYVGIIKAVDFVKLRLTQVTHITLEGTPKLHDLIYWRMVH